jgi:hypothetical protein
LQAADALAAARRRLAARAFALHFAHEQPIITISVTKTKQNRRIGLHHSPRTTHHYEALSLLALLASLASTCPAADSSPRPNIALFLADDK